ncbi:histone deacetylase [Olivibacter ginsenosidimutans]|uniref:Histone deacetylase n=2 Tax=Olivibacter ginsenosidimutans TaxID=1176537 RepID=A0ABP9BAV0_9SPHI
MMKYELIPEQLLYEGIVEKDNFFAPNAVDERFITLAHQAAYWDRLKSMKLTAQEIRRTGFALTQQLITREMYIVGGTLTACDFALENGVAFNIAGGTHHAGSYWGEGFCLLNDQAIGAYYLLHQQKAKQVLIVDLDVHQGNGTAEICRRKPEIFTFSMHAERNFPFRKETSDLDIGLADGIGDDEYLTILEKQLTLVIDRVKPDFIFYLAGVDVLATDKLGRLNLTQNGCKLRDYLVFSCCKKIGVPVQVSMGGGYSPEIKNIVDAHCNTFKVAIETLI